MAVGLGWNWVRLRRQMGFVCNRLRAKLGSFGIFVLAGVEGQRTAVLIGRNWLRFVNDLCWCVAASAGEIGFVWYFRVGGCGGSADGGVDRTELAPFR